MATSRSLDDWRTMITMFNNIKDDVKDIGLDRIDDAIKAISTTDVTKIMKTPSKLPKSQSIIKGLSSEEDNNDILAADFIHMKSKFKCLDPELVELLAQVKLTELKPLCEAFHSDLGSLVHITSSNMQKWSLFDDIKSDLELLGNLTSNIKRTIGVNDLSIFNTLWSGINDTWSLIDGLSVEDLKDSINQSAIDIEKLTTDNETFNTYWKALADNWLPRVSTLESNLKILQSKIEKSSDNMASAQHRQPLDSILNPQSNNPPSSVRFAQSSPSLQLKVDNMEQTIRALHSQLSQLESSHNVNEDEFESHSFQQYTGDSHLGHSGVRYRQYFFKDPSHLQDWMKSNMSHPSHGLFVDLVSFSEFFGVDNYVERNTTLNEVYMSSKIGYSTIADSILASSFQNVLPGAYGRPTSSTSSDLDLTSQAELPGLPSFSKWDNRDGRNGRRFWMREETRKTEQQLDGCIRSQLSGCAQLLAKDLLMDSYTMSDLLYTFISTSYEDTMHSGRFSSEQAWTLTCSFVKRIFQEIGHERVIARDGIHVNDHWATSSKFLNATLKAHTVMSEFMRLSIKDHPSISSEMVKFVCYSQPTADTTELLNRLSGVESLQRADQSNISKLETRLKQIETWKGDSEKLLKKLKEKTGV